MEFSRENCTCMLLDTECVVMDTARQSHSSNLRDLLRIKEESDCVRSTGSGLTLRAILSLTNEATPAPPNRTLLDIILGDGESTGENSDSRNTWEALRDRIRPRRTESSSSTVQIPASVQNRNEMISRQRSLRSADVPFPEDSFPQSPRRDDTPSTRSGSLRRIASRQPERALSRSVTRQNSGSRSRRINWGENAAEDDDDDEDEDADPDAEAEDSGDVETPAAGAAPPARMSLMSLLSVNEGSSYAMEEEEDEEETSHAVEYNNCCVCMVRHKGAAFIPCGHTFCRLCSRELWVQRGSCPLCNNYILEILDIF